MTLRSRCISFLRSIDVAASLSQVEDMVDFVHSEVGRAASEKLEGAEPLVLYFGTPQDRAELVAAIIEAKPGMISRKWP